MKTWTLVWFLVFPPNDSGDTVWESSRTTDLTRAQCIEQLVEKDQELKNQTLDGNIIGHELYCKEVN
jgi:hypothetical protein